MVHWNEPIATERPTMGAPLAPHAEQTPPQDEFAYRALSTGAVASCILGALSALCPLAATTGFEAIVVVVPIAVAGLVFGIRSIVTIRRMPQELSGLKLAYAGTTLSGGFLVAGLVLAAVIHATEVPEGYERISFASLAPDDRDQRRGILVPDRVLAQEGRKIFIKGYMRPGSQTYQLDEFLLVRDNNECCFGALDKVRFHDRIQVETVGSLKVDYRTGILRVGGTLHVDAENAPLGSSHAVFTLKADYVR